MTQTMVSHVLIFMPVSMLTVHMLEENRALYPINHGVDSSIIDTKGAMNGQRAIQKYKVKGAPSTSSETAVNRAKTDSLDALRRSQSIPFRFPMHVASIRNKTMN